MAKRASHLIKLIIIIIIQKQISLHKKIQNCLPVKVQQANYQKVKVFLVWLMQKGRKAQFVRFLRMGVNYYPGKNLFKISVFNSMLFFY